MRPTVGMAIRGDSVFRRLAPLVFLAVLMLASRAAAFGDTAEFNPYEVRDLAVSAVARDAVEAKKLAMDEALMSAARRVLQRVAVKSGDLDVSAEDALAIVSTIENSTEQVGPTGYSATVTIGFSPILVRGYLARRGIGVVDRAAQPILLVPVVVEDGVEKWWDAASDWSAALAAQPMEDGLTPVRLPRNTVEDRGARRELLKTADFVTLGEFRIRYRTHSAAVVRLDLTTDGPGMLVTVMGADAAGPINATVEVADGGLDAAAARVADILSRRWKQVAGSIGTARVATGSSLPVRVLLSGGVGQWETLKRRLEASGVIDGLAVEAMNDTSGNVVIWYAGRLDELPDRLARSGLDLFEAGGAWLLQAY